MNQEEYGRFVFDDYIRSHHGIQMINSTPYEYSKHLDITGFDPHYVLIKLLTELDEQGKLDFILLKNNDIAKFWAHYQERKRLNQVYKTAKEKLTSLFTDEERKLLGIDLGD